MAYRRLRRLDANPKCDVNVKKRQPRHQSEDEAGLWFVDPDVKACLRWKAAQDYMQSACSWAHRMRMPEVFDEIREDLALDRVCCQPHKWTTMVQGRPVQAQ